MTPASFREGCRAILIEQDEAWQAEAARRLALVLAGPQTRKHATAKAKAARKPAREAPDGLFAIGPSAAGGPHG